MKRFFTTTALVAVTAGAATAGGIDRTGQSIAPIFGEGTVVTFSFGSVTPDVSGTLDFAPVSSGNMGDSFSVTGFAFKGDIGENTSLALIVDEPFGADILYPSTGLYPIRGTNGVIDSRAITLVARQKMGDFGVHAGVRMQSASAYVEIWEDGAPAYVGDFDDSQSTGWLAGVSYEVPAIALRVDLTYNSELDHAFPTLEPGPTASTTNTTLPSSWNLNFQTGIAEDTLLFGGIRYVDWPTFNVSPLVYGIANDGDALVSYDNATTSYSLGLGRRFNENWSGAITLGYEEGTGGGDNFGPTDGYQTIGAGVTYTMGNTKFTLGASHSERGDASFLIDDDNPGSAVTFSGNSVTSVGLKVEMTL